jgi:hypothetical protein
MDLARRRFFTAGLRFARQTTGLWGLILFFQTRERLHTALDVLLCVEWLLLPPCTGGRGQRGPGRADFTAWIRLLDKMQIDGKGCPT